MIVAVAWRQLAPSAGAGDRHRPLTLRIPARAGSGTNLPADRATILSAVTLLTLLTLGVREPAPGREYQHCRQCQRRTRYRL